MPDLQFMSAIIVLAAIAGVLLGLTGIVAAKLIGRINSNYAHRKKL